MRAYLDSVLIIYLVEQNSRFGPAVESWLNANPCDLVSSELTRMEALVVPVRNADAVRVIEVESFFAVQIADVAAFTRQVYDRAIAIRASGIGIKTPDALHLAAAIDSGCDVFVTNDVRLRNFLGIRVAII